MVDESSKRLRTLSSWMRDIKLILLQKIKKISIQLKDQQI